MPDRTLARADLLAERETLIALAARIPRRRQHACQNCGATSVPVDALACCWIPGRDGPVVRVVTLPAVVASLTPREREVVALVAAGYTNPGIASQLGTTPGTVKKQLRAAMQKLGAESRSQAVLRAEQTGQL